MKYILAFFIIVITTPFTSAQIQKIHFVDDVETIEIVTVEVCINEENRIDQVTVIPEATSYKNERNIATLMAYLETIEYPKSDGLATNCYPMDFEFVNSKYESASIPESEWYTCEKFKTGNFAYVDFRLTDTKIERTANEQIEINDYYKAKFKVVWTSPCEYHLTYTWVREDAYQSLLGRTLYVQIIAILDDRYIYKAHMKDAPESIGEIRKL